MNCGRVEEPSSSRRRYPSTARYAATSAILTATSSKSDRAPTRSTVSVVRLLRGPGRDTDLGACGCALSDSPLVWTVQHRSALIVDALRSAPERRAKEVAAYYVIANGIWLIVKLEARDERSANNGAGFWSARARDPCGTGSALGGVR